jgi:hypothetical protein
MAQTSLNGSASLDGAINSHCRYPSGIVTPKIGEAPSVFALQEAHGIAARADVTIAAANIQT